MATSVIIMASIAATIRAEWRGAATPLVSVVLGLALLVMAGPRVIDEMALLKPSAVLGTAEAGPGPGGPRIAATALAVEAAADGPVAARANRVAGQLHMAAAVRLGGTDTVAGRAEFARAADRFAAALAEAPGDRFGWWWLVTAQWNSARHLAAARAWRLAALTGLFDPLLMFARVEGGILLWPYMDAPARAAFAEQLAVHWRWGPDGLAEVLHRRRAEAIVGQALSDRADIADDIARRMAGRR